MAYKTWTKIDSGREGLWDLDVWLGVIQLVAKHEGQSVYDESAPIYSDLESQFPGRGWKKYDTSSSGTKSFRPLFRDYSKPWTSTGTVSFENQIFHLTSLGKRLIAKQIGPSDVFSELMMKWEEDGEYPFQILATGILEYGNPLSFDDFYRGLMLGYRPGDDIENAILSGRSATTSTSATEERRLKLLLRVMELSGAIKEVNNQWLGWDIDLLKKTAAIKPPSNTPTGGGLDGLLPALSSDLEKVGLIVNPGLESQLSAALLAKRFLILTGLSGSGKTKLAHAFAAWLSSSETQYKIIAVGADWTNNEQLLGYADVLQVGRYCRPPSGALDLILSASSNPGKPYFLILDEMNLSHVERYFADILSAIESGEEIGLHGVAAGLNGVPASISIPENLFIIGTVNVDETTYMFSPKVLDRANVIEFRATAGQIGSFLDGPDRIKISEIKGKGASYAQAFISQAALPAPFLSSLPSAISGGVDRGAELKEKLVEAFESLAEIGAEFGFRTAYEISRFVYFHATLTGPGWKFEAALDAQVLQKLLPKLHGSERRLGPVLKRLGVFCDKYGLVASKEKINRMADRLKDGFTSFAEA